LFFLGLGGRQFLPALFVLFSDLFSLKFSLYCRYSFRPCLGGLFLFQKKKKLASPRNSVAGRSPSLVVPRSRPLKNGAAARLFKSPRAPARTFFARGKTTTMLARSSKHVTAPRRGCPSGRGPSRGAKMLHRQFLLGGAFCCCLTERCGAPSPAVTRRY